MERIPALPSSLQPYLELFVLEEEIELNTCKGWREGFVPSNGLRFPLRLLVLL